MRFWEGGLTTGFFSACLAFPDLCRGWQMLQVDPSPHRREKGALTHHPRESLTRKLHPTEIWQQAEASKQHRQFASYPEHEGPNSVGAMNIPIRAAHWSLTHLKLATPCAKPLISHLALKHLLSLKETSQQQHGTIADVSRYLFCVVGLVMLMTASQHVSALAAPQQCSPAWEGSVTPPGAGRELQHCGCEGNLAQFV